MCFGITPLSEYSRNNTETALLKTAIEDTPHIDSKYISNAVDTAIIRVKLSPTPQAYLAGALIPSDNAKKSWNGIINFRHTALYEGIGR